jgi:ABC-type antimicrobial peptide transport system permease subunit
MARLARIEHWLLSVVSDLRFALRMLRKSPGFTAVAILTLALGIGANAAVFSVLNAWLLRPLPVPGPHQVMVLASRRKESGGSGISYPDFLDLKNQASAFSGLLAYTLGVGGLSFGGRAHEFAYSAVTGNYFSVLGVKPALGRLFLSGEGEKPGSEISVVLGYAYWQKAFEANPAMLGKQVLVNGKPATVIGVASPDFHGTLLGFDMDGYLPLSAASAGQPADDFWTDRGDRRLTVMGSLNPAFSRRQAQSLVNVITARLALQYPREDKDLAVRVVPETSARPAPFVASYVPIIAALFLSLAVLVLLLACMNVANLLCLTSAEMGVS